MIRKLLRQEDGYSMVEVIAAMMLLTVAIIPMVRLFDVGLSSARLGGNYDSARALTNQQVEVAKSLPYSTATAGDSEIEDNFPTGTGAPTTASGIESSPQTSGSYTYTVRKTYVSPNGTSFAAQDTDSGMMQIRVTVTWDGGKSYTTTGLVVDESL